VTRQAHVDFLIFGVLDSNNEVPENVSFVQDDVTQGLPYPDESIDIVHSRLLVAGVSSAMIVKLPVKPFAPYVIDVHTPSNSIGIDSKLRRTRERDRPRPETRWTLSVCRRRFRQCWRWPGLRSD
jgi:hypothetical protein